LAVLSLGGDVAGRVGEGGESIELVRAHWSREGLGAGELTAVAVKCETLGPSLAHTRVGGGPHGRGREDNDNDGDTLALPCPGGTLTSLLSAPTYLSGVFPRSIAGSCRTIW
jgi:hypothetical protein